MYPRRGTTMMDELGYSHAHRDGPPWADDVFAGARRGILSDWPAHDVFSSMLQPIRRSSPPHTRSATPTRTRIPVRDASTPAAVGGQRASRRRGHDAGMVASPGVHRHRENDAWASYVRAVRPRVIGNLERQDAAPAHSPFEQHRPRASKGPPTVDALRRPREGILELLQQRYSYADSTASTPTSSTVLSPTSGPRHESIALQDDSFPHTAHAPAHAGDESRAPPSVDALRRLIASGNDTLAYVDKALAAEGLRVLPSPGDGNCLFSSAAAQMHGDPAQDRLVRAAVVAHMSGEGMTGPVWAATRAYFAELAAAETGLLLPESPAEREAEFNVYLQRMATPGTWGGYTELLALSELTDRPVVVYHLQPPFLTPGEDENSADDPYAEARYLASSPVIRSMAIHFDGGPNAEVNVEPLRLLYTGGNHYDALLPEEAITAISALPPAEATEDAMEIAAEEWAEAPAGWVACLYHVPPAVHRNHLRQAALAPAAGAGLTRWLRMWIRPACALSSRSFMRARLRGTAAPGVSPASSTARSRQLRELIASSPFSKAARGSSSGSTISHLSLGGVDAGAQDHWHGRGDAGTTPLPSARPVASHHDASRQASTPAARPVPTQNVRVSGSAPTRP